MGYRRKAIPALLATIWALPASADDSSALKEVPATRSRSIEFEAEPPQAQAREIEATEGPEFDASLTAVVQRVDADGAADGKASSRGTSRGDVSLSLPAGSAGKADGKIFAHLRFGDGRGVQLRPTYTGAVNSTAFRVDGATDADPFAVLAQAWYQLAVPLPRGAEADAGQRLEVTAGKIDPFVFFDQNEIADDESVRFLNNVFVHNPLLDSGSDTGADAHGFAPGAIVHYGNTSRPGAEWGISLGAFGSGPGADFHGSLAGPFVIAQVERSARVGSLPGHYRAYAWSNGHGSDYDGSTRHHAGVGASIDQQVADGLTMFCRYGQQTSGKVRFDRALTAGFELAGSAWARADDGIGFAAAWLRTSDDFRRDAPSIDADGDGAPDFGYPASGAERNFELYYRFKLNKAVDLTPDLQWIQRPGGDAGASVATLVGLRVRVGI